MKKRYVAIALCAVCVIGSVTFLFGHQKSATEIDTVDVVTEKVSEEDITITEENTEAVTDDTEVSTEEVSTEEASEVAEQTGETVTETTETVTEESKDNKSADLNTIGVTVGDSYEFEYSGK